MNRIVAKKYLSVNVVELGSGIPADCSKEEGRTFCYFETGKQRGKDSFNHCKGGSCTREPLH